MSDFLEVIGITNTGQLMHTRRAEKDGKWQTFFGDVEQHLKTEAGHFTSTGAIKVPLQQSALWKKIVLSIITKNFSKYPDHYLYMRPVLADGRTAHMDTNLEREWRVAVSDEPITRIYRQTSCNPGGIVFYLYDTPVKKGMLQVASADGSMLDTAVNNTVPAIPELVDIARFQHNSIAATTKDGNIVFIGYAGTPGHYSFEYHVTSLRCPGNDKLVKLGCAIVGELTHITAVSESGNIYHTITGRQSGWGNIETVTGESGKFTDISCLQLGGKLHIAAVTTDGRILHTYRNADGSWQPFMGNIEDKTGEAGHFVSVILA
jgi:hypothetical protein